MLNFFTQVTKEDLPDRPELRPVRRKLLEAELGYYQDFIDQQGDDPSVKEELLDSKWRTASILEEMGNKADALAVFEQVRAALRSPAPGPGRAHFPGTEAFGVSGLLTQEAVQKDLKLTEEQTKAIAALAEKRRDPAWGRRTPTEEARRSRAGRRTRRPVSRCFDRSRPNGCGRSSGSGAGRTSWATRTRPRPWV